VCLRVCVRVSIPVRVCVMCVCVCVFVCMHVHVCDVCVCVCVFVQVGEGALELVRPSFKASLYTDYSELPLQQSFDIYPHTTVGVCLMSSRYTLYVRACAYVCARACSCVCACACACTCACARARARVRAYVHACACAYMRVCVHEHDSMRVCACAYACVSVHVRMCACDVYPHMADPLNYRNNSTTTSCMPSPEGMIVREGEALKNPTQSAKCLRQYVVPGVHVCMYERERFQRQRERENFQRGEERKKFKREPEREREKSGGEHARQRQ